MVCDAQIIYANRYRYEINGKDKKKFKKKDTNDDSFYNSSFRLLKNLSYRVVASVGKEKLNLMSF